MANNIMTTPRATQGNNIDVAPQIPSQGNNIDVAPQSPVGDLGGELQQLLGTLVKDIFQEVVTVLEKDLGKLLGGDGSAPSPLPPLRDPLAPNGPTGATGPFGPQPGFQPNLTNHGGAVLTAPAIANIYVGSYWNSASGKKDVAENDAAAKDFGNSKMMDLTAQYGCGKASFLGSTVQSSSKTTFTDSDIQSIVKQAIKSGSVQKNAQGIYTVVLPPNAVLDAGGGVTSKVGLGGYHGSFDDGSGNPVYYSAIAYSDNKGNGINFDGNSQDAVNITETHEWVETMTDPDVNSTLAGRGLAWYDDTNNAEIGDEMMPQELNAGLPIGQSFERDAAGFAQQMEWSQKDGLFEIDTPGNRNGTAPTPSPTPGPTTGPGPINFPGTPYPPNPPAGPLTPGSIPGTFLTPGGATVPDAQKTPGAWLTQSLSDISTPGWAGHHRSVTTQEKDYVDQLYGCVGIDRTTVEYDHLIPLELGGGNDVTNLWPEPIAQAHVKDQFENWITAQVKAGNINIVDAQKGIASDWNAYAISVGAPANCHL